MSNINPKKSKRFIFRDATDITPEFLAEQNIKFLMMDLDNTIAAYNEHVFADNILSWIQEIKNSGVELFIISNSTRVDRVTSLSESIDIKFIMRAYKPSPKSLFDAMTQTNHDAKTSALVGDQIFTDGIAARKAGITSILVRPRRFTNPFLYIRYLIELPLRAISK